ncbi:MAG: PepSY domain-containing protein [Xanthomonadaceae bacterium]|nr:PepSY domain-containing protein [Xanthomonadaceae bacterium]
MNAKRTPWTARRIHLWVSIALSLVFLLIAISGAVIGARSALDARVPMRWMSSETIPDRLPVTAYAEMPDGSIWIGNGQGLHRIADGKAERIDRFRGKEILALAAAADNTTPIVATKMVLWSRHAGEWKEVKRGRLRQLSTLSDGSVLAIVGGRGEMANGKPFMTRDGSEWRPYRPAIAANAHLPPLVDPTVDLQMFMRELHSGAYFFGKGRGEIVWSLITGLVLVLLCLTGLWMWGRREWARARNRRLQRERSTASA